MARRHRLISLEAIGKGSIGTLSSRLDLWVAEVSKTVSSCSIALSSASSIRLRTSTQLYRLRSSDFNTGTYERTLTKLSNFDRRRPHTITPQ